MALKKSELYSSLWSGCDELRGGMDASQYKDYVLVLLFVKYVSDKYAGMPYAPITIPEGASFKDMAALKGMPDIGEQINKKIIAPLANANKLSDMPDFNGATKLGGGKEMVDRLTNLVAIFENKALDFSKNRAEGDDILGDAYEYLMRHFATESGKSKGQFYTPAEVSRVIARILCVREAKTTSATTVYDPTCGSGSLLLKVADEAKTKLTLYGQEKDAATSGLARMNMILHNNPEALIVVDKQDAHTRKGVFMIDASAGFMKNGNKNRLRAMDIHKIVDVFTRRLEVPKYSRMVSFEEIERNEHNLNIPRYIDSQQAEDLQDIEGHLKGGIPATDVDALERYWAVCPKLRKALFKDDRPGYLALTVEKTAIKPAIYEHPEFAAFIGRMNDLFSEWRKKSSAALKRLKADCHPKDVIAGLSEDLLAHYADKPLIDRYDVYQHLMDYWVETMQDDCFLIADDGWKAETYRIVETDKKGKERDKGWACDLVPKFLIVARYFAKEREAIAKLEAELEGVTARMTELEEEHGGEDGLFSELEKVNKASVASRLKEICSSGNAKPQLGSKRKDAELVLSAPRDGDEEVAVLRQWLELCEQEADLKCAIKDAEADLDAKAYAKYPTLDEDDVKTLVVDDKWLAALAAAIHGEMDRISQALTQRVKELAERYESPMPIMAECVAELEARVNGHLQKMGFTP